MFAGQPLTLPKFRNVMSLPRKLTLNQWSSTRAPWNPRVLPAQLRGCNIRTGNTCLGFRSCNKVENQCPKCYLTVIKWKSLVGVGKIGKIQLSERREGG